MKTPGGWPWVSTKWCELLLYICKRCARSSEAASLDTADCFRSGPPVKSEGGWLSTGNTVMRRSYTGRLCWAVPLVLPGFPPSQHAADFSVSPSEITKVMVSRRGVSPISSPKSQLYTKSLETVQVVLYHPLFVQTFFVYTVLISSGKFNVLDLNVTNENIFQPLSSKPIMHHPPVCL